MADGGDVGVGSLVPAVVTSVGEHGLLVDVVTPSGTLRGSLAFAHLADHPGEAAEGIGCGGRSSLLGFGFWVQRIRIRSRDW